MDVITTDPYAATPLLRRQRSLEFTLDFRALPVANTDIENIRAKELFDQLVQQYHLYKPRDVGVVVRHTDDSEPETEEVDNQGFLPDRLLYYVYKYSPTADGKTNVVQQLLRYIFIDDTGTLNVNTDGHKDASDEVPMEQILQAGTGWAERDDEFVKQIFHRLETFAVHLLEAFFVPLKSSGHRTPTVPSVITPIARSDVPVEQTIGSRLKNLRDQCMRRDGSRCVVSGLLDWREAEKMRKQAKRSSNKTNSDDDDGETSTEAAHIIPHSLNSSTGGQTLASEKRYMWRIMNMFDPGISQDVCGADIDKPHNALILSMDIHSRFGSLKYYFEETADGKPNSYHFKAVPNAGKLPAGLRPKSDVITFVYNSGDANIDLPSPRLLRFHRACALIMHLSGAGEYIERLLDDTEALRVLGQCAADGSTDFSGMFNLKSMHYVDVY